MVLPATNALASPDPPILRPARGVLHSHEMDGLLAAIGASMTTGDDVGPGYAVRVDLSRASYITPSGMAWLWAALRSVGRTAASSGRVAEVCVIPPSPDRTPHYFLKWMGLYERLVEDGVRCDYEPPPQPLPPARERALKSETLLTMTPIRSVGDVRDTVAFALGHIGAILRGPMGYGPADVQAVALVLSEACTNICDHALGSPDSAGSVGDGPCGMVTAQLVRPPGRAGRPRPAPYLMIGVADDGCGIRRSLQKAHPQAADWTDEQVLHAALRRGVSGVPDEDRGLGLDAIASLVARYQGTLHLRSGGARLRIKARGTAGPEDGDTAAPTDITTGAAAAAAVDTTCYPSCPQVPGTMLCVTLRRPRGEGPQGQHRSQSQDVAVA
jgi:anti-sigma regulatory factor (Ser/Thr protein kinase)